MVEKKAKMEEGSACACKAGGEELYYTLVLQMVSSYSKHTSGATDRDRSS